MKKNKNYIWSILLICFLVGLGIFLISRKPLVMQIDAPSPIPTVSPIIQVQAQVSPDGSRTVSLKTKDQLTEILVNDKIIMTWDTDLQGQLMIPFNTWSPDNKYFFLNVAKSNGSDYVVISDSGMPFVNDTPYYLVAELFAQSYPDDMIVSVTGWAAPTLLIINATSDQEVKMSFWFDIQFNKFIRLSSYFY